MEPELIRALLLVGSVSPDGTHAHWPSNSVESAAGVAAIIPRHSCNVEAGVVIK